MGIVGFLVVAALIHIARIHWCLFVSIRGSLE